MTDYNYPESDQVVLVIENEGEIVFFSLAAEAKTHLELMRRMQLRTRKMPDFEPVGFKFDNPDAPMDLGFNQLYPTDVILVDKYDTIIRAWTEPANPTPLTHRTTVYGLCTIVLCSEGLSDHMGIVPGISKLTLRSSMSYGPIYCQQIWAKELKVQTDEEIIKTFNGMAGKKYGGPAANAHRSTLGQEILSRSFDSSLLFELHPDGSIKTICFAKKVKLVNNKLEYE